MIVEELIEKLQAMPQDAKVELVVVESWAPTAARSFGEEEFSVEEIDGVVEIYAEDEW